MTELPKDITRFLDDLGQFASRELPYRPDVGTLLHQAKKRGQTRTFEELIFLAKFVSKTFEVIQRIGPDADAYQKLMTELRHNLEKANALAKALLGEAPQAEKQHFQDSYFNLDQQSFGRFLGLLGDLSWVKNWRVDGKPLP